MTDHHSFAKKKLNIKQWKHASISKIKILGQNCVGKKSHCALQQSIQQPSDYPL